MFAIIDLETTGLDPRVDRIIEIAILLHDGQRQTDVFTTLVNPEELPTTPQLGLAAIPQDALRQAPPFYRVARQIVEFTEKRILVAHNARFDYAFLRKEFQRLGYHYQRRQLCTMRLCRDLYPALPSYRLSRLCRHFDIPHSPEHRAFPDARATLQLFEQLRKRHPRKTTHSQLDRSMKETILPPGLPPDKVAALPEKTGIYYFYDQRGVLIYVGKSKNIRKRVWGHFSNDLQSPRSQHLKSQIVDIRFELTGSELVALLWESDIIKRAQPLYNRDQRNTRFRYGLFVHRKTAGYIRLSIQESSQTGEPLLSFKNRFQAIHFLERLMEKYRLCQKLCGLHNGRGPCFHYHLRKCCGACVGEESVDAYNRRVRQAIRQFHYRFPNFYIIDRGRHSGEQALVVVSEGIYRGFGFVDNQQLTGRINPLALISQPRQDNQDIRKIITQYLKQLPPEAITQY